MSILVTGSTGVVGTQVLQHLAGSGADIHALTRSPDKARFPDGVRAVQGDLTDLDALRSAMEQASTLFLLAPNAADEFTQALQALSIARESGAKGIVYLSVFKGEEYVDVPHFSSKRTAERMIKRLDLPATVLRPTYFMQNDVRLKDALLTYGVYGMPIGAKGISMVDVRDIGDAAARELLHRERADAPLPQASYELVGPDAMTADSVAALWSEVLGREIRYGSEFAGEMSISEVWFDGQRQFACFVRDITDRRRATEADERLRLLINLVSDYAICMLDHNGIVRSWNDGVRALYGWPKKPSATTSRFSTPRTNSAATARPTTCDSPRNADASNTKTGTCARTARNSGRTPS